MEHRAPQKQDNVSVCLDGKDKNAIDHVMHSIMEKIAHKNVIAKIMDRAIPLMVNVAASVDTWERNVQLSATITILATIVRRNAIVMLTIQFHVILLLVNVRASGNGAASDAKLNAKTGILEKIVKISAIVIIIHHAILKMAFAFVHLGGLTKIVIPRAHMDSMEWDARKGVWILFIKTKHAII